MLLCFVLSIVFSLIVLLLAPQIIKKYKAYRKQQMIKKRQKLFKKKMQELEIK